MAVHRETAEVEGPFSGLEPIERLLDFYMANGYRIVERRGAAQPEQPVGDGESEPDDSVQEDSEPEQIGQGEVPSAESSAPLQQASFERGRKGAGWWTSDMTELHTRVVVRRDDDLVRISYDVDTSGQMLSDIERAFWRREAQAARKYVRGDSDTPRDLRDDEARRAKQQQKNLLSIGLWGAVAVFFAIVFLGFMGLI